MSPLIRKCLNSPLELTWQVFSCEDVVVFAAVVILSCDLLFVLHFHDSLVSFVDKAESCIAALDFLHTNSFSGSSIS